MSDENAWNEGPMSRTIRDANLDTRAARLRIAPSSKASWKTLVPRELHLGYRRKRKNEPGLWLVRRYIGGKAYRVLPLGIADDFEDSKMTFAQAQRAAHEKTAVMSAGGLTVGEAIANYIRYLASQKATAYDAEMRARKWILPTLGSLKLSDLSTTKLTHWLEEIATSPALVRTRNGEPQKYAPAPKTEQEKRSRKATANRTLTVLKAACNRAYRHGAVDDNTAWERVEPFKQVDAARPGYLTVEESQRLINACDPDFRPIVHAALLTGCRYGELRAMCVRDYQRGKLHIPRSKSGKPRTVVLTEEGSKFFDAMTVGKSPDAPMFVREDGDEWGPSHQIRRMDEACAGARIKPAIGFHALRHTWASLAVMNGMPLLVVARSLGHATTAMVERHYGHLADSFIDEAIRNAAPRFGISLPASNVKKLDRRGS
jgi:integrase